MFEKGERVIVFFEFIDRPDVFLIEFEDRYFTALSYVDENGVELGRIGIFFLALVLVFNVDLLLR